MTPRLRVHSILSTGLAQTWALQKPLNIALVTRSSLYAVSWSHISIPTRRASSTTSIVHPTTTPPTGRYDRHKLMASWHKAARAVSPNDLRWESRDEIDSEYVIITDRLEVEAPGTKLNKADIISRYGLHPRDLKALDAHILDVQPSLLVAQKSIVLCTPIARAIISYDRMVVIAADRTNPICSDGGAEELIGTIVEVMRYLEVEGSRNGSGGPNKAPPFELRALEAMLLITARGFKAISNELHSHVYATIPQLRFSVNPTQLHDLLEAKRMCEDTLFAGRALQSALSAVLAEDEDLAAMYITDKIKGQTRAIEDHQSAELLLEYYERRLDETNEASSRLSKMLVDIDSSISLTLASTRVRMQELELQTAIAMSALSAGAVIAGLFGMNLVSGWEDDPSMFAFVTTGVCTTMGAIFVLGWLRFSRARRSQLMLGQQRGRKGKS